MNSNFKTSRFTFSEANADYSICWTNYKILDEAKKSGFFKFRME
jgi:hypothetical protein